MASSGGVCATRRGRLLGSLSCAKRTTTNYAAGTTAGAYKRAIIFGTAAAATTAAAGATTIWRGARRGFQGSWPRGYRITLPAYRRYGCSQDRAARSTDGSCGATSAPCR